MATDVTTPVVVGEASDTGVGSIDITLTADIPASTPDSASLIVLMYQADFLASDPVLITMSDEASLGPGGAGQYLGPNFQLGGTDGYGGVLGTFIIDVGGTNHRVSLVAVPWLVLEPLTTGQKITIDFGGVNCQAFHVLTVALQGMGDFSGSCSGLDGIFIPDIGTGGTGEVLTYGTAGDNAFNVGIQPSAAWNDPPVSGNCVGLYMVGEAGVVSGGWPGWVDGSAVDLGSWTDEGPSLMSMICGYREFDVSDTSTFDTGQHATSGDPGDNKACKPTFFKPGEGPGFCIVATFGNPTFNRVVPV